MTSTFLSSRTLLSIERGRPGDIRDALSNRLKARRSEIEEELRTRISAISGPSRPTSSYVDGLRAATSAALEHGFEVIERGEERARPVPYALLSQARLAANSGVSLDSIMRRYFAGHALLSDFVLQEADDARWQGPAVRRVTRDLTIALDRVLIEVADEYSRETDGRVASTAERRAERVRKFLAGEPIDLSSLAYNFEGWHLGAVTEGTDAIDAIRKLASDLGRPLLSVRTDEGQIWGWLGGTHKITIGELDLISSSWPDTNVLTLGEPARGHIGWRTTHRQAIAALPIARRGQERLVRYADTAILASMSHDDLAANSLRQQYLIPLSDERDGGEAFRDTLRAYIATSRNVSLTAERLGVSRRTVHNRLRAIEDRIGQPLGTILSELDIALRLHALRIPSTHLHR